jgi:hypothetical protein
MAVGIAVNRSGMASEHFFLHGGVGIAYMAKGEKAFAAVFAFAAGNGE